MPLPLSVCVGLLLQYLLIAVLLGAAWRGSLLLGQDRRLGPRLVIAGVLFFSANVVLIALPGVFGWLTAPVVALLATVYAVIVFLWPMPSGLIPPTARTENSPRAFLSLLQKRPGWLAIPFVVLTLPHLVRVLWLVPVDWDSHSYHLFMPAFWIQQGQITEFEAPRHYTFLSFYPKNFECTLTFAMIVASNDLFAKWFTWPCIGLCGLTVGLVCRQLGGSQLACWASAAMILTTPLLVCMAATTKPDPMMAFALLTTLWLLLRILQEGTVLRRLLFLVGLSCGLAVGAKYSSLYPAVVVVLAVPLVAAWSMRSVRGTLAGCGLFALGGLLTGGWWFGLNYWITGNPVYPVPFGPFAGIQDESLEKNILARFASSNPGEWLNQFVFMWQVWSGTTKFQYENWGVASMSYGYKAALLVPLLILSLGAGTFQVWQMARRRQMRDAMTWTVALTFLVACLYAYLRTPYWNEGYLMSLVRISLPATLMASALGFAVLSRLALSPAWFYAPPLIGAVLDMRLIDLSLPGYSALLVVLVPAGVIVALWYWSGRRGSRLAVAVVVVLVGLFLPLLCAYRESRRYAQYDYWAEVHGSGYQLFADGAGWLEEHAPCVPVAVAFGSEFDFLYLFVGPDLQRPIVYVPTVQQPVPSWKCNGALREGIDETAWRHHLATTRARYLVCCYWLDDWPPERAWAIHANLPLAFKGESMEIYDIPGQEEN